MRRWLTTADVLALTQWSASTLYRHVRAKRFPAPISRGRWCLKEIDAHQRGSPYGAWTADAEAIRKHLPAPARGRGSAQERHVERAVSRAPQPTVRLAYRNPSPPGGPAPR